MQSPSGSTLTLIVVLPLLLWRAYARLRRLTGRQRLSRVRPWITLTVLPLIVLALGGAALHRHPERLAWLGTSLALGAALGIYGLRKTRFEPTPGGFYYTPSAHLGIALSLLFVGRIVYRFVEIYLMRSSGAGLDADFARSPLTLAVFGLLAGYYISYAIGLLRWRFAVPRRKREREAAEREAAAGESAAGEPS